MSVQNNCFVFYIKCFDYKAKSAKYVWYTIDKKTINSLNIKKRPSFYSDKRIPKKYRVKYSDYTHNSFHADRGHLAPDAAFDYSKESLHEVYSMINIIPQYYLINRITWRKLEQYERMVAYKLGSLNVINGVDYGDYSHKLNRNEVTIPVAFWKVMFANNFKACFYYKNNQISKQQANDETIKNHKVDCKSLGVS